MAKKTDKKTVSNLSLFIGTILDLIETDELLDMKKAVSVCSRIDKFLYDVDRQLKKKGNDEYYQLDFSSADMQALAVAAEKQVTKLRPKCTYRSMRKALDKMTIEDVGIPLTDYRKWTDDTCQLFFVIGSLHRLQCVASYQATILDILEKEDEDGKIENVMLKTLREVLKKDSPNIW
jgi:hypothetical protein